MGYRVAVAGATGAVGYQLLEGLHETSFPVDDIAALASRKSQGRKVSFGDDELDVQVLDEFDFSGWDIALFSPGGAVSKVHAPRAAAAGCVVIDNSSTFRMDSDVPLIVPEVNREALGGYSQRNIVSNPNCSTIQMVVALKPLHDAQPIRRIVVSTYQSVSGAGRKGMDELWGQTRGVYQLEDAEPAEFTKEIAFNVVPHIDVFMDDGSTKEEWKMAGETRKILDADIAVTATCVRVPVFVGHAEAVNVEFDGPMDEEEAYELLSQAPGVEVVDRRQDGGYVTPKEAAGDDTVFVSRIRRDPTVEYGLNLWVVSDNLRKGAATNAVQIARELADAWL